MKINHSLTVRLLASAALLTAATASLHAQSPPPNDDFANRQVLPSQLQVTVKGTTDYATQEDFEKVYGAGAVYGDGINEKNTVWYDYTAPVSGRVHLSATREIDSESYTLVFKGGAIPVAAAIVSQGYLPAVISQNPDFLELPPPDFAVTAGQEYTISLGTTPPSPDADDNFTLTLTLTPGATPTPTPTPVASVAAQGKADRASGQAGKVVFTLSAAAANDVTLTYKTSGDAVIGTDYKRLPGTVVVPAGKTSATVKVKPRGTAADATVAVHVKLQAGEGYTVGSAASAKVKIVGGGE